MVPLTMFIFFKIFSTYISSACSRRINLYCGLISVSLLNFCRLAFSILFFPNSAFFSPFCQTNKSSRFPSELHFSKLLFSKALLIWLQTDLGARAFPHLLVFME